MQKHILVFGAFLLSATVHTATASQAPLTPAVVNVQGVSSFSSQQLFQVYQPVLGEPLTGERREALRQRLLKLYEEAGYPIPDIVIRPASDSSPVLLVSVQETQKRGTNPDPRLYGRVTYSTEGSDRLGRQLLYGRLILENATDTLSEVYLSGLQSIDVSGTRSVSAGVTLTPAARHELSLATNLAEYELRDTALDNQYQRQWYRADWHYQLVESNHYESRLTTGLTARDYTFDVGNTERVNERLRVLELALSNRWRWTGRMLRLKVSGRQGIDAFGAQREDIGAARQVDLDFTRLRTDVTLWQALPWRASLRWDLGAQFADDNLPFSERFAFGGYRFARAYEPGEFSGDKGLGSKLELRRGYTPPWLPAGRLVPYAYYGIAKVFDNQRDTSESGASTGIGLRWLSDGAYAYLEIGQPMTADSDYRDDDARIKGRISIEIP